MENNKITIYKENGEAVEADILFTYYSEEFQKHYIVMHIVKEDVLTAAQYIEDQENGQLIPVESEEEWDLLNDLLEEYYSRETQNEGCQSGCGGCQGGCDSATGEREGCCCDSNGCSCDSECNKE